MKLIVILATAAAVLTFTGLISPGAEAQSNGEALFSSKGCVACHTIGGGRLLGPDLKDVHKRRDEQWLVKFIRSPKAVIESGDPTAVVLFDKFNQIIMPDAVLSDNELKATLAYIRSKSGAVPEQDPVQNAEAEQAQDTFKITEVSAADSQAGKAMFVGTNRLSNKGAACTACHHVDHEGIFGGTLAKDLTHAYSRLKSAGIDSILRAPPFPAMKAAYAEQPLMPDEIVKLKTFLYQVDKAPDATSALYGRWFFFGGIAGVAVVLLLISLIWWERKIRSVKSDILSR